MNIDVKINLKAIADNIRRYKNRVILMVKGDAYGHGLIEVSRYVEPLVYGFGVATIEEGIALRENGIKKNILICQLLPDEVVEAMRYNLTPTIESLDTLQAIERVGGMGVVKVNTGMNRFGFDCGKIKPLMDRLNDVAAGVYSHIYSPTSREEQCKAFCQVADLFKPECDRHIYASSTAPTDRGIVRIGINAYKGAMTVESKIVSVRRLEKGDIVGYGCKMDRTGYVAWIFGGYADGINRERPQPVLVKGKICPVVAVCMDTICVYTGDYMGKIGERVVLQNHILTPEYIAENTGTIPYVVIAGRSGRINRAYIQ